MLQSCKYYTEAINELLEKAMAPTPVLLPGKSHRRRSLVGCSPWGREESDMTDWLPFHFSLSCIGEGNGNPLQCSCLENPRDGGSLVACHLWGCTESDTTGRLSSSSSVSLIRSFDPITHQSPHPFSFPTTHWPPIYASFHPHSHPSSTIIYSFFHPLIYLPIRHSFNRWDAFSLITLHLI